MKSTVSKKSGSIQAYIKIDEGIVKLNFTANSDDNVKTKDIKKMILSGLAAKK